jgi:hypothetical protein
VRQERPEHRVPDLAARPVSELRRESRGTSAPQAIWLVNRPRRSPHREAWQGPMVRQGPQAHRVQQHMVVQGELPAQHRARQAPRRARLPPTAVLPLLRPEPERGRLPELLLGRQLPLVRQARPDRRLQHKALPPMRRPNQLLRNLHRACRSTEMRLLMPRRSWGSLNHLPSRNRKTTSC